MDIERICFNNINYGLVIRKGAKVEGTRFFTGPEGPMQLGVIKHEAGYMEVPHTHRQIEIKADIQQMLYITRGKLAIDFFDNNGDKICDVILNEGDTVLLMSGGHAIRVIEDLECLTVKQGPYVGIEKDKINLPAHSAIKALKSKKGK